MCGCVYLHVESRHETELEDSNQDSNVQKNIHPADEGSSLLCESQAHSISMTA